MRVNSQIQITPEGLTMKNSLIALIALSFAACSNISPAQSYSITWSRIAGGGGTSGGAQFMIRGTIGQHEASGTVNADSYSLTGGFWAISAVQTPGAPTLFIATAGPNAVVSWPAGAAGYYLQSNSDVAVVNGWAKVLTSPVSMNGFYYVTNPIVAGNQFYRLHSP